LAALGFVVDKAQVRMPEGHIKTIGDHPVSIGLHTDVVSNITVSVLGEH
jgi:large subunit ribosomal protein L9